MQPSCAAAGRSRAVWGRLGCILLAAILLLAPAQSGRAAKGRVTAQARVLERSGAEQLREETAAARRLLARLRMDKTDVLGERAVDLDRGRLRVRCIPDEAGGMVQVEILGS
jgi:hypothetical protein